MKNRTSASGRLYYLDWLRVLAMFGIFFFHNARFYDVFTDWHVKNASTDFAASMLVAVMVQWIMPLFFLIAGAGTFYALKNRTAGQHLNKTNRFLAYANEAVLPFYILHQTIIIVIGYYVVQWDSGVALKYCVISITSFIAIMAIYELLVRRINVLRFLFGMKWSKKPSAVKSGLTSNSR